MNSPTLIRIGLWCSALVVAFAIGHFTGSRQAPADDSLQPASSSDEHADTFISHTPSGGFQPEQFSFIPQRASRFDMISDIAQRHNPADRMQALLAVIETLEPGEFQYAIERLERSGLADLRRTEHQLIYFAWAQTAPEEAMAYASQQFDNTFARKAILESWATHDPENALVWARENYSNPNADLANPWELSIVLGAVANDLELATSITHSMSFGSPDREAAASAILGHLNSVSPELANNWVQAIAEEEFRNISMDLLAQKIVQTDPENAFERVSKIKNGYALEKVAEELAHRRYLENPDSAKAWVKTLPEWAVGEAAKAVVNHNVEAGLLETSEWLDELMASNSDGHYQEAIETMVIKSTLKDPQLAAEWIPSLHSKRDQGRYYQEVLSEWIDQDPQSAQDWVQYNYEQLPESVLVRFYPDFVPEVNLHNRDESGDQTTSQAGNF